MSTEPPSPADQPVPPPQRSAGGVQGLESAEEGLWDLEHPELEDADGPPPPTIPPAPIPPKAVSIEVTTRNPTELAPIPTTPIRLPGGGQTSVMRRMTKADFLRAAQPKEAPITPTPSSPAAMEPDFDDLEDWATDEPAATPASAPAPRVAPDNPPASTPPQPAPRPDPSLVAELPVLADLPEVSDPAEVAVASVPPAASGAVEPPRQEATSRTKAAAPDDPGDEFSYRPAAKPVARGAKPRLRLSLAEKAGLAVLLVVLLAGGVWAYRLAVASIAKVESPHGTKLPAKGEFLTISRIESYWRPPITSGEQRESVRLGVTLIPVVEITVSGQGAIRALFSNDTGSNVGDPVDRRIDGETTVTVACTDGFKDLAEHRAYQVDFIKAWHIRLLEAPATTATGQAFKPLASAPVSSTLK